MASAYELMLVLRGRNYLSNDLRRAGADIGRLKSQAGLQNARNALQINARRLATTRQIAQEEMKSITSGTRRNALDKAVLANKTAQVNAALKVRRAEEAIEATQRSQLTNQANLSRLQRTVSSGRTMRGFNASETQALFQAAQLEQQRLMSVRATQQRALEEAQRAIANSAIATQGLTEREAALTARQAVLTDRIHTTSAALDLNTVKLNENALAMKRLPLEKLGARAQYVEHLGRAFQTLGLVSVAALGYAAHSASQFNTQLTLASTQATLIGDRSVAKVQQNSAKLQQAVQDMLVGGKTAAKPTDLTGGLYTIFSGLSLQGNQTAQLKEGVSILKEFNKVYTANFGQVEFNDVTKAGIALINNFGLSAKSISPVMNQMQASVRFGAMTMSDLTTSLNQVIPAFKSAGYSTKQMFADIAFVSRLFPSLKFGTTGLARLTETFAKYHEAISQDVGTNIAPGGQLLPINQIVEAILKAHPTFIKGGVDAQNYFKAVTNTTGTIQARRAFTGYLTNLALYHDVAGKVVNDTQELSKSFTDMSQTPQVRWAEFTNQLRGLVLEIGSNAMPVFQKFAKPISDAVKWFDSLSPSTKKLAGEMAVWISIGMLFGGTALVVVGALVRMYAGIRLFFLGRAGILALEDGFIGAGTALRVGFIGALIIAIPLLVKYHAEVGHIVDKMGGLAHVATAAGIALGAWKLAGLIANLAIAQAAVEGLALSITALQLLIAAPLVLTVLLSYEVLTDPNKLKLLKKTGTESGIYVDSNGNITERTHTGLRGGPGAFQHKKSLEKMAGFTNRSAAFGGKGSDTRVRGAGDINRAAGFGGSNADIAAKQLATVGKGVGPFTDADVLAAVQNIVKLDDLANRTKTIGNYKKANAALADLQKKANKDQFAAAQNLISALESQQGKADKKSVSSAKKAAAERLQALKDAASNAMSMYDSLLSQNQSIMGQLFSGPFINSPQVQNRVQFGGKLTSSDYLKDLKSQTSQFSTFYSQIAKLQRRGAPQELINQLIQQGPSALPAIKALAGMSSNQWGKYVKVFKTGQELLHKQTMVQLTAQLKDYRKYGEKIALQIISGMRDKRLGLANEIQNIIKSIFGVTVPVVTAPSKSDQSNAQKVAKQAKGKQPHGVYNPQSKNTNPVVGTSTRTTQGVTNNYNYNVTAPTSEHTSVKTQLRHAEFASKSKYERTR